MKVDGVAAPVVAPTCITLVVLASACSPPAREQPDAAVGDPDADAAPFCGDGFIAGAPFEACDDGTLTGTDQSLCTRQCRPAFIFAPEMRGLRFPFTPTGATPLNCQIWAFTANDDQGIRVAFDVSIPPGVTTFLGRIESVRAHARAVGVGGFRFLQADPTLLCDQRNAPLWIEQRAAGVGGPWLLYATFDAAGTAEIHEVPYPFPDGRGGTIVTPVVSEPGLFQVLVDQSVNAPYDLLVAVLVPRALSDIAVFTARFPAPSAARGVLSRDGSQDDMIDRALSPSTRPLRFVQFFDNSSEFVTIEIRHPVTDMYLQQPGSAYTIFEFARGDWPFRVVQAVPWLEGATDDGDLIPTSLRYLTHPQPRVVLADTGDIYMWQFDHSYRPEVEPFLTPFTHVPAGSLIGSGPYFVSALQPDGSRTYFADSDDERLDSGTLKPQPAPNGPNWSVGRNPDGQLSWGHYYVLLDDGLYAPL